MGEVCVEEWLPETLNTEPKEPKQPLEIDGLHDDYKKQLSPSHRSVEPGRKLQAQVWWLYKDTTTIGVGKDEGGRAGVLPERVPKHHPRTSHVHSKLPAATQAVVPQTGDAHSTPLIPSEHLLIPDLHV